MSTSKEFRRLAKELAATRLELDSSACDSHAPGYIRAWRGIFLRAETYERLRALYLQCIAVSTDADEVHALQYAYSALLREGLRLDEAASQCRALVEARPEKSNAARHLLAHIEARRGNMERAKNLAVELNADARNVAFRVAEEELQQEFAEWQGDGGFSADDR